jgi:hypothetical protein
MKQLFGIVGATLLFLQLFNCLVTVADTLTLASGEVVEGTITSETDAEVQAEITNESRTISFTRIIRKAEIKSITRDSPEQKIHQNLFSALDRYKLYPSQEFPEAQRAYEGALAKSKTASAPLTASQPQLLSSPNQ